MTRPSRDKLLLKVTDDNNSQTCLWEQCLLYLMMESQFRDDDIPLKFSILMGGEISSPAAPALNEAETYTLLSVRGSHFLSSLSNQQCHWSPKTPFVYGSKDPRSPPLVLPALLPSWLNPDRGLPRLPLPYAIDLAAALLAPIFSEKDSRFALLSAQLVDPILSA